MCTLGPASASVGVLKKLINAGMNVVRLNFSHGDHAFYRTLIQRLRALDPSIAILQDLQGPKLRVGALPDKGVLLEPGQHWILYPEKNRKRVSFDSKVSKKVPLTPQWLPLSEEVAWAASRVAQKNTRILFDDGKLVAQVLHVQRRLAQIEIQVKKGGVLFSHKGVNLPGTALPLPCITEKDWLDLEFGLAHQVDAIALSFVRSAQDILELKKKLLQKGPTHMPLIIPKIELEEAIQNQEAIIGVSDGLLIARGDMAVEIGAAKVPIVQKQLIRACNHFGVPVITATQMLESMVHSVSPTRAEATDVANAVLDGTDAVMLSAETATGAYPVQAVKTMSQIILEAERSEPLHHAPFYPSGRVGSGNTISATRLTEEIVDAIEKSAALISEQIGARAIVCISRSGKAVRVLAKYRPKIPILALVPNQAVFRSLCFVWGVRPLVLAHMGSTDRLLSRVCHLLKKNQCVKKADWVVLTAGIPSLRQGKTNMVQVEQMS